MVIPRMKAETLEISGGLGGANVCAGVGGKLLCRELSLFLSFTFKLHHCLSALSLLLGYSYAVHNGKVKSQPFSSTYYRRITIGKLKLNYLSG